jgi:outer membrane protein assembly factor BamA
MLREMKYCLWLLLAVTCCHFVSAQNPGNENKPSPGQADAGIITDLTPIPSDTSFKVRNIIIEGNKRTRDYIVLREIPFKTGEAYSLPVLVKKFEIARRQLMNTALFHEVVVALKSFDGYDVDVLVKVKERWYIFPVPYFKPVDRNINQWIIEEKASLSRVNYGAKLLYNNVTGRNDKLRAYVINGYTKQLSFSYDRLYIDRALKLGLNVGFSMGKNKEHNYNTINNKQVYLKDDKYVRNFMTGSAELTYRRAIKTRHRVGITFNTEEVSDSVLKLNPSYFQSTHNRITYPEIYYAMTYYDLDYIPYPTKGYAADIIIGKKGFNSSINLWQLSAKGSANWPTGKKSFFTVNVFGNLKLPLKQPYFNQRLLGYGDAFLQGYEYYVIDGVAAAYIKTTYTRKLVNFDIKMPGGKKREASRIPFKIYGKVYGNAGYVDNPQPGENFLINKMLYSAGIGIDVITLYDLTFKLEWSFNQLGQNGIFLHRKSIF